MFAVAFALVFLFVSVASFELAPAFTLVVAFALVPVFVFCYFCACSFVCFW